MPAPLSKDPFGVALYELRRRVVTGCTFAHSTSRAAEIMMRRRAPHGEELDAFVQTLAAQPHLPPLYFLAVQLAGTRSVSELELVDPAAHRAGFEAAVSPQARIATHRVTPSGESILTFVRRLATQLGVHVVDLAPTAIAAQILVAIDRDYDGGAATLETLDDVPVVNVAVQRRLE